MVVLRLCHANTFRCSFLKITCYGVSLGIRQLPERIHLQKCTSSGVFKCPMYVTYAAFRCWNCQTVLDTRPSLFCKNCSLIQSSEQQNFSYFELLNIPEQYDVDTGQLTTNFRKLQNLVHPDKFSNKTEEEKIKSASFSSLLNKAYTTLSNPLLRGLYMLNTHGLSIEEGSITMDTSFLGEIMEWNEYVEDANTKEALENLKKDIEIILQKLYKNVSKAFRENNIDQAKLLLSKAKYFSTLIEKIKETDTTRNSLF